MTCMRFWMVTLSLGLLADCTSSPPPVTDNVVPPRPAGAVTTTRGNVQTFALDTILLGDLPRDGDIHVTMSAPSAGCGTAASTPVTVTAWETFGFDLDGLVTTKTSTNVCTLTNGAPASDQVDGEGGIDNAWGATLVPILQTGLETATLSADETALVAAGSWTLQIEVDGLPTDGVAVDGIGAQVFVSGAYDQGTPAFDASTDWPVLASSTVAGDGDGLDALVAYEDAYVTNGTFVSGTPSEQPVIVPLVFRGVPVPLRIHRAVITFELSSSDPTRLVNGTLAGVLVTSELVATLRAQAGLFSTSLCGSAFDGVVQQVAQAEDILEDETNVPDLACDAISIGIGFTAKLVANPTKVVPDPTPPPDPCAAM
jgi:hypothetical protein